MTAEGDFLSGYFAWAFRDKALRVIQQGWTQFQRLARQKGWKPKAVPTTSLGPTMGRPTPSGGVKLEVVARDLPRGEVKRPGRREHEKCAHNVSWLILNATEARQLVTARPTRQQVPSSVLAKMSKLLKDCVRGQCSDWPRGGLRNGKLFVQRIKSTDNVWTMRISGFAILSTSSRYYAPQLHGECAYDVKKKRFTHFELMAAGQRKGRTQFNFRQNDLGPAPLGIAFRLHE